MVDYVSFQQRRHQEGEYDGEEDYWEHISKEDTLSGYDYNESRTILPQYEEKLLGFTSLVICSKP